MIQTITEKSCLKCGAEIRPDTQFCYNCGSSLVENSVVEEAKIEPQFTNGFEAATAESEKQKSDIAASKTTGNPRRITEKELRERRQQKLKKDVQIVWQQHDNPPNLVFVIGAIILALIAVGLVYLMLQVR